MLKETQELSTYRKNQDKYLMRCLIGLLNWLTSKITNNEEQIIIVLTKNNAPTFYRTASSIRYIPPQTTIEKVTLKTSDWKSLEYIDSIQVDDIKELIEKNIPGVAITTSMVNNTRALIIDWNHISISFIEDDKELTTYNRIPIPYRVLTFLSKKPDCIVKGKKAFHNRLGMSFEQIGKVVYVGAGRTYFFNENGFNYFNVDKIKDFKQVYCKDYLNEIEHRKKDLARAIYKREVNKYFVKDK